jgi:uncharacterized membrane protein YeaQ/YmgE (transglycosylase-associated protein family)
MKGNPAMPVGPLTSKPTWSSTSGCLTTSAFFRARRRGETVATRDVLISGLRSMAPVQTMVPGIIGAVVGGFLDSLIQGAPGEPVSPSGNAWHGWVVAPLGAALVLRVHGTRYPRTWWQSLSGWTGRPNRKTEVRSCWS